LDLILHTPGGGGTATESIMDYLRKTFGNNIRTDIPQLAMSADTMMALSCRSIVMGKQLSLGEKRTCTVVTQLSQQQKLNQQIVEVVALQIHMTKGIIGLEVPASRSSKK